MVWQVRAHGRGATDHPETIVDGLDHVGTERRTAGRRVAAAREVDAGDEGRFGEDDADGRSHVEVRDALTWDHLEHLLDVELRRQRSDAGPDGPGS